MSRITRVQQLESFFNFKDGEFRYTVIGFVSAKTKKLVSAYRLVDNRWTKTSKEPTAYFAEVLAPMFIRPKRFIILIGGRGSGKTVAEAGKGLIGMHDLKRNLMCIREFQSSVADSVHAVLSAEVSRLEFDNSDDILLVKGKYHSTC